MSSSSSVTMLLSLFFAGALPLATSDKTIASTTNSMSSVLHRTLKNPETGTITHPLIPHKLQMDRRRRELRDADSSTGIPTTLPPRPNVSRHSLSRLLNEGDASSNVNIYLDDQSRSYISALRGRLNKDQQRDNDDHRLLQQQMGALYQGYGTHYVDLWLGTPTPQRQTVIVDTGSGVTAFPCEECTGCGDSYHTDGYFKESLSETFRALTCDECMRGYCASMSGGKKCRISMSYAEGSSWSAYESLDVCYAGGPHDRPLVEQDQGNAGVDVDHINPVEASQFAFELAFGCQVSITGLFITQLADGIMGMENDRTSFWKQMHGKNAIPRPEFSLCFSRQDDASREGTGAGAMTLGGVDKRLHMNPMVFAKNVRSSGFYTVHLKAVYLREGGGQSAQVTADDMSRMHKLDISESSLNSGNVIVDSGTTDTYFTRSIDRPFKNVWKQLTGKDFNHNPVSLTPEEIASMPTIIMVMQGHDGNIGDEATGDPNDIPGYAGEALSPDSPKDIVLAIPASHYMEFDPEQGKYVMRFYADESSGSVLGANAMMGHDVYFDTEHGRIGWAESDCDYMTLVMEEGSVSVLPENPPPTTSTKTEVPVENDDNTEGDDNTGDDVFTDEQPSGEEQSAVSYEPPVAEKPSEGKEEHGGASFADMANELLTDMQHSCSSTSCRGIAFTFILAAVLVVSVAIRRAVARRRVVRQYQEAELEISDLALDPDSDDEGGYVDEPPLPRIT